MKTCQFVGYLTCSHFVESGNVQSIFQAFINIQCSVEKVYSDSFLIHLSAKSKISIVCCPKYEGGSLKYHHEESQGSSACLCVALCCQNSHKFSIQLDYRLMIQFDALNQISQVLVLQCAIEHTQRHYACRYLIIYHRNNLIKTKQKSIIRTDIFPLVSTKLK